MISHEIHIWIIRQWRKIGTITPAMPGGRSYRGCQIAWIPIFEDQTQGQTTDKKYWGYNRARVKDGRRTKIYKGYNKGRLNGGRQTKKYRERQKLGRNAKKLRAKKEVAIKMRVTRAQVRGDKGMQGAPKGCQPLGDQAQSRPTLRHCNQILEIKIMRIVIHEVKKLFWPVS